LPTHDALPLLLPIQQFHNVHGHEDGSGHEVRSLRDLDTSHDGPDLGVGNAQPRAVRLALEVLDEVFHSPTYISGPEILKSLLQSVTSRLSFSAPRGGFRQAGRNLVNSLRHPCVLQHCKALARVFPLNTAFTRYP